MKATSGLVLLLGWVVAVISALSCPDNDPSRYIPGCTHKCLANKPLDGTCSDDFAGFCNREGGIKLFSDTYTSCIFSSCDYDSDITQLVTLFHDRCEGTKYGPLIKFGGSLDDYLGGIPKKSSDTPQATSAAATSSGTSAPPSLIASSNPPASAPQSPGASNPSAPTEQSDKPSQAGLNQPSVTANGQPAPVPGTNDGSLSTSFYSQSTNTAAAVPHASSEKSSGISKGQVVGSAAGGTAALAALIGAGFFFLRRRRRRNYQSSTPNMWSPDRNTSHKSEKTSDAVFEKHSETGTGGAVGPAELHSYSARPTPIENLMNERYPTLSSSSLTKSLPPGLPTDTRYYSPTTQTQLDAVSPSPHVPELDTFSPLTEASTMNAWPASPTSSSSPAHHAELDTDRVASPVSELGSPTPSHMHPAELHGEAAPPRYVDLRDVGGLVDAGTEQRGHGQEQQEYMAYNPNAGVAKNS